MMANLRLTSDTVNDVVFRLPSNNSMQGKSLVYDGTTSTWTVGSNLAGSTYVTVSPTGIATGGTVANDGADFGPDTPGTQTTGIQEAIDYLVFDNVGGENYADGVLYDNLSITTNHGAGVVLLLPGMFLQTAQINLKQGIQLIGNGRLSTAISLNPVAGSWLSSMVAQIYIPANENECLIQGITVMGNRSSAFSAYQINGIEIEGYNWRPVVRDVEIQNQQGMGLVTTGSSTGDNYVFEPLFDHVSVMTCTGNGMNFDYAADDIMLECSVQNCSQGGIRYNGGDGNWFKPHVYNNLWGITIAGAPVQIFAPILDSNQQHGLIVDSVNQSIQPGAIKIVLPLSQYNGSAAANTYAGIYLHNAKNVIIYGHDALNKTGFLTQAYALLEDGTSDYNTVIGGSIMNMTVTPSIVTVGAHTFISGVYGYTPGFGITPPIATPVSGTAYTNNTGMRCRVWIATGSASAVTITDVNNVAKTFTATLNPGYFATIEPGEQIAFTFSSMTWQWEAVNI